MKIKFKKCEICGNIVAVVFDSGLPITCCGREMSEIIPNTIDAAVEKHIPQITLKDSHARISVGETEHPMNSNHYIEWIAIETTKGNQRKELKPGDSPVACFALCENEEVLQAFAYCNIHGLWKKTK